MKRIIFGFVLIVLLPFAADLNSVQMPASVKERVCAQIEAIHIEAECVYAGVTHYPPWLAGRGALWEPNVQITDLYDRDDQLTSMAVDAIGQIYVCYDAIVEVSPLRYGAGIAWSSDNGVTWNNIVYFSGPPNYYSVRHNEIAITDDGKLYVWGSLSGGASSYTNIPVVLRSHANQYNDATALAGWNGWVIPDRIFGECVTWGDGDEFVLAQYTVDRAGSNDSISCFFTHDSVLNPIYYFTFQIPGGNPEKTTIGVDVVGNDTILIHGIEYYDAVGTDWDVVCYLDTLNGSGNFYGWSTSNTNDDRYPSVFCSQGCAYIAYQADVGGGDNDILFNYSTDYGTTWLGAVIDLTNDTGNETYPRLYGDSATIGVDYMYAGDRVRFNYSFDNGMAGTWLSTPETVTDANTANNSYHSVSLLHTPSYWHAAWEDTRYSGTDGLEIYTSRRVAGQGDIDHRPAELVFDYRTTAFLSAPGAKYVFKHAVSPISQKVSSIIAQSSADEFIPIFIMLSQQLSPDYLIYHAEQRAQTERRKFVIDECKTLAAESQQGLLTYLRTKESEAQIKDIVPIWSINMIGVKAKPDIILELAQRNDVWQIGYEEPVSYIGVNNVNKLEYQKIEFGPDSPDTSWGIIKINADDVWDLGYTGAGVVVGHIDGGVNYNHTDLTDHMWDGSAAGYPNHGYDFDDEDNDPIDEDGHGTWTAGVVAGDGTSGTQTGVAPDAQIMVLRTGTNLDISQAIDFALEHGADLISQSVGFENPSNPIKDWGRGHAITLYATGLVWCVAAGNGISGFPGSHYTVPQDIVSPADCPGPYYAPNGGNSASIAIGATDSTDSVPNWSSYGPTVWNTGTYTDYPYPPGLVKPDVAAPGAHVVSLDHATTTGYDLDLGGTSVAQPHLAGTIALMLERNPGLTPRQIDSLIQTTALDIETSGRDSLSGAGRIDALQAVNAISEGAMCEQLWVINQPTAAGVLQVTDITKEENQSWIISILPTAFTVPIDDSELVWVTVDTTGQGLDPDAHYYDTLLIWSNTIAENNPERVPVVLHTLLIGVEEDQEFVAARDLSSLFVVPNPFKNIVRIDFTIPFAQNVKLIVYDVCGREVRTLIDGVRKQGNFSINWDGTDDHGKQLSAGIYFCRIESEGDALTNKLILLK